MALPYKHAGTFIRSAGLYSALAKQAKLLNLKAAKRIHITFDPFGENVVPIRNALTYFYQERVQDTNPKCVIKTSVICSRADPTINITLESGHKVLLKTKNLQALEILQLFNKFISSKAETEDNTAVVKLTKAQRKK